MEDWKSFFGILIKPPVTKEQQERGSEIGEILRSLSKYAFDPVNKYKNKRKCRFGKRRDARCNSEVHLWSFC